MISSIILSRKWFALYAQVKFPFLGVFYEFLLIIMTYENYQKFPATQTPQSPLRVSQMQPATLNANRKKNFVNGDLAF